MKRQSSEELASYMRRVSNALSLGEIGYKEWSESLCGEILYNDESLRRCNKFIDKILENYSEECISDVEDEDISMELRKLHEDIKIERVKLANDRKELNDSYRWQARNELYKEKILSAINGLEPINIPNHKCVSFEKVDTTALIAVSDFHAGSEFEVKGLYGEVVNKYNYDIMIARMWELLNHFCDDDIICDDITVAFLGDFFENVLRMSSLSKLKEPVIDTVIKFSEFLAVWIAQLHERTELPITVVTVGGNHDVQRLLNNKPQFEDENLAKIVVEFLKLRLRDFKDITIKDYTDVAVENIRGTSVMFQHGDDKDLQNTIDYFSNLYNVNVDEIIAGHLHRPESKTIGISDVGDRVLTRVGSLVGTDTYAKKIRVSARPSAYVALYTEDGKTWNRNYYL